MKIVVTIDAAGGLAGEIVASARVARDGSGATTPASVRLFNPRHPIATAEEVCDDHAAEILDETQDEGYEVVPVPPGAVCERCAEARRCP